MSRSGYVDDVDDIGRLNLYRANIARTIGGRRGQAFLREMGAALDAMSIKELVSEEIVRDPEHVARSAPWRSPWARRLSARRRGR